MPQPPASRYAVSACLLGIRCRYDGGHKKNPRVIAFLENKLFVPVCPEILSGLPLPRRPARLVGGDGQAVLAGQARVELDDGTDVTDAFRRGASEALAWLQAAGCTHALLKEKSPSCGVRQIDLAGQLAPGLGVFAALAQQNEIQLVSETAL